MKLAYKFFMASVIYYTATLASAGSILIDSPSADRISAENTVAVLDRLGAIIQRKFDFYNKQFPDIQFIHLKGRETLIDDMNTLRLFLGEGAMNLDYAHPEKLRETVLEVTSERVQRMLWNNMASATLFQVGMASTAQRRNVCAITLEPQMIATDNVQATRYMVDLSEAELRRIPPSNYLDSEHHLEFTIDHEAYHCLDSFYNGPAPMSDKPYAADYDFYSNENGADAYGLAMHIKKYGKTTTYARDLMRIRGLSLFNNDPNHCTCGAIDKVLEFDPYQFGAATFQELFRHVSTIRDTVVPDYDSYMAFRIAAFKATEKLGVAAEENDAELTTVLSGSEANPRLTQNLIDKSLSCYKALFAIQAANLE